MTSKIAAGEALPDRERTLPVAQAGGAKPIAATETGGADRLAAAWGGLEGFTPPHRFKARTAASDGQRIFTRAARQRMDRVCGEVTVKSSGQGKQTPAPGLAPHPPQAVPLPLRGEGLNALQVLRDFPCRERHFQCPASEALPHRRRAFPFAKRP